MTMLPVWQLKPGDAIDGEEITAIEPGQYEPETNLLIHTSAGSRWVQSTDYVSAEKRRGL